MRGSTLAVGLLLLLSSSALAGHNETPVVPSSSILGGVKSIAASANKWINSIGTDGVPTQTQPACGNLSNAATSCSTDATNAGNISAGTLPIGRMPALTGDVTSTVNGVTTVFANAPNGSTINDAIMKQFVVSTGAFSASSSSTGTTLGTITGLSVALVAGKTYSCHGHLNGTSGASGGIKVALVASGGLSATSASFTGAVWNGLTAVARTTVTALGSSIAASTAVYTDLDIVGAIVVNVGGTINVQAAQNVSNGTATTVGINSVFSCVRVN